VGMYIDDVPIATAYRNEWDLSNSMLFDLESIEVSKGFSSPLLASNNGEAGVINIRTHKPDKPLDLLLKYRNSFDRTMHDQGRLYGVRLGTKQPMFYLQVAAVEERRDFFRLPNGFEAGLYEKGGRRDNSDFKNSRINVLAGFTPTDYIDIMVGYVRQEYEKGQPWDAAPAVHFYRRFWIWPEYQTERYYLNADLGLGEKAKVKLLAYYDKHYDKSIDYLDATLTTKNNTDKAYDQFTKGAQLRLDYEFNDAHKLGLSAGWRELSHKDIRWGFKTTNPVKYLHQHSVDEYVDLGAEYTAKATDALTLSVGLSWTKMTPQKDDVNTYPSSAADAAQNGPLAPLVPLANLGELDKSLLNWQVGAFWEFSEARQLFATIARKGRMPSMREQYYRDATNQAYQPRLNPETVMHYEVGFRGRVTSWLEATASVYYSDYRDKITGIPRSYYVNASKTTIRGLDLAVQAELSEWLLAGATFSLLNGENEIDPLFDVKTYLTDTPKYQGSIWAEIKPVESLTILPRVDFSDGYRTYFTNQNVKYEVEEGGFVTADLKVTYDINQYLTAEIGAKNIFDALYTYSYYYPEQGRNYYLGLTARY
jgi:iron complex outermembrane receptor protein